MIGEFGEPEGFTGFIPIGSVENIPAEERPTGRLEVVGRTRGFRPRGAPTPTLLTEEEEPVAATVLGG